MTLFYDLHLLESKTGHNSTLLVETLKLHFLNKRIPKNPLSKVKPIPNLYGNSFILNAAPLFAERNIDVIYKAQYILLAGRRDYMMYKLTGHKHLDLSYFLDINIDAIKHNPLLTISDNKIYFKYEES